MNKKYFLSLLFIIITFSGSIKTSELKSLAQVGECFFFAQKESYRFFFGGKIKSPEELISQGVDSSSTMLSKLLREECSKANQVHIKSSEGNLESNSYEFEGDDKAMGSLYREPGTQYNLLRKTYQNWKLDKNGNLQITKKLEKQTVKNNEYCQAIFSFQYPLENPLLSAKYEVEWQENNNEEKQWYFNWGKYGFQLTLRQFIFVHTTLKKYAENNERPICISNYETAYEEFNQMDLWAQNKFYDSGIISLPFTKQVTNWAKANPIGAGAIVVGGSSLVIGGVTATIAARWMIKKWFNQKK